MGTKAVKIAFRETCSALRPMSIGMFVGILISLAGSQPTMKTWICWFSAFLGLPILIFLVTWIIVSRLEKKNENEVS